MNEARDFKAHILNLAQDPGFRNELAQVQSKALLRDMVGQEGTIRWTYIAHRLVRNASIATFELEEIGAEDPQALATLEDAARQLAHLWESLAKLGESTTQELALLNAAVNYELAGYQANAMCLAKNIVPDAPRGQAPSMLLMGALFLQRRFIRLLEVCSQAQKEPDISHGLSDDLVKALAEGIASKAFAHAAYFFLRGTSDDLDEARVLFKDAERLFADVGCIEQATLAHSLRCLLPVLRRRATWTLVGEAVPHKPKWLRYLKLLARGTGANPMLSRSISELWPSQVAALASGLLTSAASKIVRMPTSAGKTRIAELAIIHTLMTAPGSRCVYIAPYRALVSELEQSLVPLLGDLGLRASSVTGTYESDDFEDLLCRKTDVLIVTPEKLDLLVRIRPELVDAVRLFITDEAHILQERSRGLKFELLLTRLRRRYTSARFLMLSAVVSDRTLEDFAHWLRASPENDVMTSTWRPSIQRHARLDWQRDAGVLRYSQDQGSGGLREFVPGVIRQRTYEYKNLKSGRINRRTFPDPSSKAQIAAELAFKFAELGPVLVFCAQASFVAPVADALTERIRLAGVNGSAVPAYFRSPGGIANDAEGTGARSLLLAEEWLGDRPITHWLRIGIGVHYGELPDVIRTAIERDFRNRALRVLVATNTLAQGVNLPVKTVIVHGCRRYVDQVSERLPARDYWNIAGRAGRAGEETEGLIIHPTITPQDHRDVDYYLAHRTEVEPVESALYRWLLDLVQGRLSPEALGTEIDPEILAVLAEETSETTAEPLLDQILDESLVAVQASRDRQSIEPLKQVFESVAASIRAEVPKEYRRIYSATGLSSRSCRVLVDHITTYADTVRQLLRGDLDGKLGEVIRLLVPVCLTLTEIRSNRELAGNPQELVERWARGDQISSLLSDAESTSGTAEELGRYIDAVFRYRLPWGIASYLRLAERILSVDEGQVSECIRFLPSMIKFGVPTPQACWAMAAGIPLRQVAIRLAAAYVDAEGQPGYEGFLQWLGDLNTEKLINDFHLNGPLLEDVTKAIYAASSNPLLAAFEQLDAFLPHEVQVQGIEYGGRSVAVLNATVGQPVELVRDYDNLVDRNAILVYQSGQELGYLPRSTAQVLAPELDTGAHVSGVLVSADRNQRSRLSIRILRTD